MNEDEKKILDEMKKLGGRANAEALSESVSLPIRYIQYVLRNLHEARFLRVDTLARYPMYRMNKLIRKEATNHDAE